MGGRVKSDEAEDKKLVASAVHKHEAHMHKGEPATKLRDGGMAGCDMPAKRMDKRARGGRVMGDDSTVDSPHGKRDAPHMTAGAMSGKGRLEKGAAYGANKRKPSKPTEP